MLIIIGFVGGIMAIGYFIIVYAKYESNTHRNMIISEEDTRYLYKKTQIAGAVSGFMFGLILFSLQELATSLMIVFFTTILGSTLLTNGYKRSVRLLRNRYKP